MTDKVERVARAMCEARGWNAEEIFTQAHCWGLRKLYLKLARAAVAAMKERRIYGGH